MRGKIRSRVLLALGLAVIASLFSASSAFAIFDHNELQAKFPSGCADNPNPAVQDMAVDEALQRVYTYCEFGEFGSGAGAAVYSVNYSGAPVNWEAVKPYIAGNALIGNPGAANGSLNAGFAGGHIAVDNSGGPNEGLIYILAGGEGLSGGSENIQIFAPSGEYLGAIVVPTFVGSSKDIDVGPDGSLYFLAEERVSKYNTGYNEVARMYTGGAAVFGEGNRIAAAGNGAVWTVTNGPTKFEPDQLFTNFPRALGTEVEAFTGKPSPFVPIPLTSGEASGAHIAVDPTSRSDLYVNRGSKVEVFSEGNASEMSFANAPAFGNAGNVASPGIAVTKNHLVFTSAPNAEVSKFGPGQILPNVHTHQVDVDHVGHESAELDGEVDLDGGTPVTSCELQYGTSTNPYPSSIPCTPSSFGSDSAVEAEPTGLTKGVTYHYRFKATNEKGTNFGIDHTFVPAFVLDVKTLPPSPVAEHEATLRGSLDPDGIPTEYFFKYGVDANYGQQTETFSAGSGSGATNLSAVIQGLPSGKEFHYQIIASNANGTTVGGDQIFRTSSAPDISGVRTSDLTETAATLHAIVNPVGFPTTYRFEYGPSTSYGSSIPVPDESLGTGTEPIPVEQRITGLTPGVTYHFRVVATNEPWGTSVSPDTTFDFAPPACPNDHVRQETASTFLPDCRAYELVSPGRSGAVQLFPSQEAWDLYYENQDPLSETGMWPLNNGLASSPPRFMFYGILGTVEGLAAPNGLTTDSYLATRTNSGWVTTLPGLTDHFGAPNGKECSDSMGECLEYNKELFGKEEHESEAYLYTADGKFKERLPSISNIVPGANQYKGFRRTSGDFTNYAFSSAEMSGFSKTFPAVAFTVDGQTTGIGSAYDNDLQHRSVELISKVPGGGMIPQMGSSKRAIQFPGMSADGSHILMLTEGGSEPGPPYHLYMTVDDAIHYDVSKGSAVEFVGMTRDGSSVSFTSAEQLTSNDTDNSIDLYRWNESTDSLTLLSVGNGKGNSDDCEAEWIEGCGVEVPNTERRYAMLQDIPYNNPNNPIPNFEGQPLDDVTAEDTGDVFFYSPELLDGTKFGIPNQRNLYVANATGVHFVATMEVGKPVKRMTIARDGRFAAFLTPSRLTSYDNRGFDEVYLYNAEDESLVCASCRPDGPPTKNITVSMGGKFMSDDGRVFFATKDSLVPRDKNGQINDVYEYVGGRPQLISGALAGRDFTGEAQVIGLFAKPETTGLEAVSRDGQDVFFSTFATLVNEDHNGQYVKFYDARTNGGFAQPPLSAPCAAADECHGADSSPPPPPTITSGTELGASGNIAAEKKPKQKKSKKKKSKKKKKAPRKAARAGRASRQGGRSNG